MSVDAIQLAADDDVATALRPLPAGAGARVSCPAGVRTVVLREAIPAFHKIALADRSAGAAVCKYGAVIGALAQPVAAGALVHTHNLKSLRAVRDGTAAPAS